MENRIEILKGLFWVISNILKIKNIFLPIGVKYHYKYRKKKNILLIKSTLFLIVLGLRI